VEIAPAASDRRGALQLPPDPASSGTDLSNIDVPVTHRRCTFWRTCPLVVLMLSCAAGRAAAQASGEERPRMNAGPLYFTPTLQLKYLGIDNNVFNEFENPKSDFTFTVGPQLEILLPVRRFRVIGTGALDYVYFKEYASQRGFNTVGSVRAEALLNRLTLFARDTWANTRERLSLETDQRRRRIENGVDVGVSVRVLPKVDVDLSGRRSTYYYPSADEASPDDVRIRETQARTARGVNAAIRYRVTPLTTVMLEGEAREDRFDFSQARDADVVTIGPSVEFKPRALISGRAHVAWRNFKTLTDTARDFTGIYADVGLSYVIPVAGGTRITAGGRRDVVYSTDLAAPYYVVNGVSFSVTRPIGLRWDVTAGLSADRFNYETFVAEGEEDPAAGERTLRGRTYTGSLGYRLRRDTRIGFGVWYDTRKSATPGVRDFDGLRVGTTVTYGLR
jgi:hypothetical protein